MVYSAWNTTCFATEAAHPWEDNMSAAYADWRQLAEAASTEMDSQRLMQLIEQLTEALDESRQRKTPLRPRTV